MAVEVVEDEAGTIMVKQLPAGAAGGAVEAGSEGLAAFPVGRAFESLAVDGLGASP